MLPSVNGKPNFETMSFLISAIQKLVMKDVVCYIEKRVETAFGNCLQTLQNQAFEKKHRIYKEL